MIFALKFFYTSSYSLGNPLRILYYHWIVAPIIATTVGQWGNPYERQTRESFKRRRFKFEAVDGQLTSID